MIYNTIFINIIRFIFLVLLQVLVLNNIRLIGYVNPFLYVLFILMLPFNTPNWLVLILGFILGISVDMFSDTNGIHAASSVIMAYMRPLILKLISPSDGYNMSLSPTMQYLGLYWFLSYSGILIFFHHLVLFYMEIFRFGEFFFTFFHATLSSLFTLILVFVSQFFLHKTKEHQ